MWPFTRSCSLAESGLFEGFTDWHSHILPAVDDGVRSVEEALEILHGYEALGMKTVWLTPHIMEDMPNTPESLKRKFEELRTAYSGRIGLHLAAEHMLDNLFDERLNGNDLLPIGRRGNHLLVETSYFNPPLDLEGRFAGSARADIIRCWRTPSGMSTCHGRITDGCTKPEFASSSTSSHWPACTESGRWSVPDGFWSRVLQRCRHRYPPKGCL